MSKTELDLPALRAIAEDPCTCEYLIPRKVLLALLDELESEKRRKQSWKKLFKRLDSGELLEERDQLKAAAKDLGSQVLNWTRRAKKAEAEASQHRARAEAWKEAAELLESQVCRAPDGLSDDESEEALEAARALEAEQNLDEEAHVLLDEIFDEYGPAFKALADDKEADNGNEG